MAPIPITKPRQWVEDNISMIHLSLTLMMLAGKAGAFIAGIPDITRFTKLNVRLPVHSVDDHVSELATLLRPEDELTPDAVKTVAIGSRKAVWELLKEKDPRAEYAGLVRVVDSTGAVHWTQACNKENFEKEVEATLVPQNKTPQPGSGFQAGSFL